MEDLKFRPVAESFSLACDLMVRSSTAIQPSTLQNVKVAASRGRVKFLKNSNREPIGYYAYASVSKDTLRFLELYGVGAIYLEEWIEGRICLIKEFYVNKRIDKSVYQCILREALKHRLISFVKNDCLYIYKRKGNGKFKRVFKNPIGVGVVN